MVKLIPAPPYDFRLLDLVKSRGSNQGRSVKCRHVECFDIDEIEDSTCPVCRTVVESADFYVDYQVSRMMSVLYGRDAKGVASKLLSSLLHVTESPATLAECFRLDPWSARPIQIPVRGADCKHYHCFDFNCCLATFQSHRGTCPFRFCLKQLSLSSLLVDDGFLSAPVDGDPPEEEGERCVIDLEDVTDSDSEPVLKKVKVEAEETPPLPEAAEEPEEHREPPACIRPRNRARLRERLRGAMRSLADARSELFGAMTDDLTKDQETMHLHRIEGALNKQLQAIQIVLSGTRNRQVRLRHFLAGTLRTQPCSPLVLTCSSAGVHADMGLLPCRC
jgi:hypothetical protein